MKVNGYKLQDEPESIRSLKQAISSKLVTCSLQIAFNNCFLFPIEDPTFPAIKKEGAWVNYGFSINVLELNGVSHVLFDPRLLITKDGQEWNFEFSKENDALFHAHFISYEQFVGIIKEVKNRLGAKVTIKHEGREYNLEDVNEVESSEIKSTVYEPKISFGDGMHHDFPAAGLKRFGPWDHNKLLEERPSKVTLGIMGNNLINPLLTKVREGDGARAYPFLGFEKVYKIPLDGSRSKGVVQLTEAELSCCSEVEALSGLFLSKYKELGIKCDVLVIELPASAKTMFKDINLHDLIKVIFWGERVSTQIVLGETVTKNQSLVVDNLALGLYVGAGGKPWILDEPFQDSIFLGISFGLSQDKRKIVGIIEVFDKYGLSTGMMVSELKSAGQLIDEDRDFHLTKEQFNSLITSIIEKFSKLDGDHPINITIHKTTRYNNAELAALEELEKLFDININLVYINAFGSNLCLIPNNFLYPPQRLQYWNFENNKALLYTLSANPQGASDPSIPKPMIVELSGKSNKSTYNIDVACADIIKLTKLNWNSSNSYEREPVTISRSRKMVALLRAGLSLNDVPEDVKYFI